MKDESAYSAHLQEEMKEMMKYYKHRVRKKDEYQ
jgi:hypothetical protein